MNLTRHESASRRQTRRTRRLGTAIIAAAALVSAVGATAGAARPQSGEPVTVRWFVGLGTGTEPEQIPAQEQLVEEFNASQDGIELQVEIVDNNVAYETLATQIAAGEAPDIIGPVGVRGSNYFAGNFLDLDPLMESTGFDLSVYDEAQVEFWREDDGSLTGVPFGVFPSMIYYNAELFDEAGLDYPPTAYGEPYADGDAWDMDKVAELAMLLTVDANGNDATSPDFDRENVVQWGFHHQFNDDARAIGTLFGPGSFVADDGSAQIPENWLASWQWYVDLVTAGAAPNQSEQDSDVLGAGNAFNTGNVAMAFTHLWYTGIVRDDQGNGREFFDIAPVPEYNGVATAKLHADTFRILDSTANPEAAFEVLSYLLDTGAPVLLDTYGGMPARIDQRDPFFAQLDEVFPQGVNWQVAEDGLERPDVPNHESNMPNFDEAEAVIDEWETRLDTEPGLDVAAAAEELRVSLDAVFGGAPAPTVPGTEPAGSAPTGTEPAGTEPAATEPAGEAPATTSG